MRKSIQMLGNSVTSFSKVFQLEAVEEKADERVKVATPQTLPAMLPKNGPKFAKYIPPKKPEPLPVSPKRRKKSKKRRMYNSASVSTLPVRLMTEQVENNMPGTVSSTTFRPIEPQNFNSAINVQLKP